MRCDLTYGQCYSECEFKQNRGIKREEIPIVNGPLKRTPTELYR